MLLHLEQLTSNVITDTNNAYSTCLNNMNSYLQTVRNDRNTLVMQRQRAQQLAAQQAQGAPEGNAAPAGNAGAQM